jgi:hypothetical protein
MFMLSFNFVIDVVCGLFEWKRISVQVFHCLFIYVLLFEIQLSRGEDWDPVIKRGGLRSSYQEGRIEIQLSRGEDWDPVIKRGGLKSSYQEGRIEIQLSRGGDWDPSNLFNPNTLLSVPIHDLDFQHHMSWSFCVQWVEVRGTRSFCWYWWNYWPSPFKLSFHSKYTVKSVLCDLPRKQWNMVIYDRWLLNTGLIDMKCTVKGNKN